MSISRRLVAPIVWMIVLWLLSSLPSTAQGTLANLAIPELVQNAAHPVAYAILAAAWRWALTPFSWTPLGTFGLSIGYGVIDELHQAFVPGRTSSLGDLAADAAGAALALWLYSAWIRRRARPHVDGPLEHPSPQ